MSGNIGVNETREAIDGIMEVALVLAEILKDGVQLSDVGAIFSAFSDEGPTKDRLQKALDNIGAIPAEMKDLDLNEGLALGMSLMQYAPRFVAIFSEKK